MEGVFQLDINYKNNIAGKDIKNILRFCEKFNVERALLITKDLLKEDEFELKSGEKIGIGFIPAWMFLLDI